MKTKGFCWVLLSFLVLTNFSEAQISPKTDRNWVLNEKKSDEFNSHTLDTSKWKALDPTNGIGYNWGGGQIFKPENVSINGMSLELKVEDNLKSHKYSSGGIQSIQSNYSYGYFEIYAKLPGYYNDGIPCGKGFWPAFWTYHIEVDSNGCRIIHDEIDILEPSGSQYAEAISNVAGWHDESTDCKIDHIKVSGDIWYTHTEPLFEAYHKYAAEWLPDRIIFYFDDQPFYQCFNHEKTRMKPQFVVIDQQIDGYLEVPYLYPNTPLPQYMSVDYFRYYELKTDLCEEDATILNNRHLNEFNFGVRKNIIIGDNSSVFSLSKNDNITFRFTNEIKLEGGFTVPLGAELNLIPTPLTK